jgi:hypothetical protein
MADLTCAVKKRGADNLSAAADTKRSVTLFLVATLVDRFFGQPIGRVD